MAPPLPPKRTFAVKKLGNTKIDSWIVMPIMTI